MAPSASLGPRGGGPRIAEFAAFTPALAAQAGGANPKVRFVLVGQPGNRSPLIWTITLLAIGTVGLALAARLAFCALMLAAALPWLRTETQALDLLAIPQSILPR